MDRARDGRGNGLRGNGLRGNAAVVLARDRDSNAIEVHDAIRRPEGLERSECRPHEITYTHGRFFMMTGRDAVVVVDAEGRVVTTWATSSAGVRVLP